MKEIIRLTIACTLLCICACVKSPTTADVSDVELPLSITKSGDDSDGKTVSAYLFNGDEVLSKSKGTEGTYYISGTTLVPCSISGGTATEDHSKGLRVNINTDYKFSLASPAESLQKITGTNCYGIHFTREQEGGKEKRFISVDGTVTYGGFYLNATYSYNVGVFKEKRSKVRVKIACGSEVDGVIFHSAVLTSVLKSSWYLPQTGLFYHSDATDVFESSPVSLSFPGESLPKTIASGQSIQSATSGEPYIIAQDYAAKDGNNNPLYVMPRLELKFGTTGDTVVSIPLNYTFGEQEIITMTVTVKSTITGISLGITDWTSAPASSVEFDYQPETDDSLNANNWQDESDSCIIGE